MTPKRVLTRALLALLVFLPAALASAQTYTKIVVFGDSLSDTGNDTYVSATSPTAGVPVPSPYTGYTNGRFTDGPDTIPAAVNYTGVWLEQLAAMFPATPIINYSLNPAGAGTNYAYGFATTNVGYTTFSYGGPNSDVYSFQVENMGQQVSDYLATNPTIDGNTLFIVWGGANDLIAAAAATDPATAQQLIIAAAQRDAGIVQTLINAGATDFIVPNLPPLGLVPRFNTSPTLSAVATQAAGGFDQALAQFISALPAANATKTLHIYPLDTYTLFNTIVAAPANYGFANVTMSSSAAVTNGATVGVNPDTYLFWDDLHPTTHGHNLIANAAMTLLGTPITTTTTLSSDTPNANQGANVTFTATVTSTAGSPMGTVTFTDGSTTLYSAVVTGTTTASTVTYSTATLSTGTHTIQATFTGANGYVSSSTTVSEVVTAPAFTSSVASPELDIRDGATGLIQLTITPVGGIKGTATIACGSVPAHITCSVNPSSVMLDGSNTPVTATVSIGTSGSAALMMPGHAGDAAKLVVAFALPGFGLLGFSALRRRRRSLRGIVLSGAVMMLLGAGALGMTGCGGDGNNAKKGSYPLTITTTVNNVSSTAQFQVVVQ